MYIGEDKWIGANAVIIPSVRIGKNTVVGAGSVVTKDIPEYGAWYLCCFYKYDTNRIIPVTH